MRRTTICLALLALLGPGLPAEAEAPLPRLQLLVDAAPAGSVLRPPPGTYAGPVTIDKPLTLDGEGQVTVTGQGKGTILTIHGDGVTVHGLTLDNSGRQHEALDACLRVERGKFNVVKDNTLHSCLVGIDLRHADNNILRRNTIKGTDPDFDIRGDGIRVWYSNDNKIEYNTVTDHRDVLVEYSTRNLLRGNSVSGGRYGTHCMYSSGNTLEENFYEYNTVGVFSMYSSELVVRRNRITHGNGPAAMGIGLKEASSLIAEDNDILGNAIGVYLDQSPFDPDRPNRFHGNRFGFNGVAMLFHADLEGNEVVANDFFGNHSQVNVQGGGSAQSAKWEGNYWDTYEGFDRTGHGYGETPFELYAYADRLWADVPPSAFFRGSPMFESLDFLARLAPFSKPQLILRDPHPAMHKVTGTAAKPVG